MDRCEKVGKVDEISPEDMGAILGRMIAEEFGKAGLTGYQHCVMCTEISEPKRMAALVLPYESFDVDEQAMDPAIGLTVILHVLEMMDNAIQAIGRQDMQSDIDTVMETIARPIIAISRLVSVELPMMTEQGGTPIIWKINGGDEGSVLIVADGRHFSNIDGLPDAYIMGSLLDFFIDMVAKGAGRIPTGEEMQSIISELESEINNSEKEDQDGEE